jgi:DNA processing protein
MDLQKEFFACLALRHTPRLGPKVWKPLLLHYESAFEAVRHAASWPAELAPRTMARACAAEVWRDKAEEEYRAAGRAGMTVITWFDARFPDALREIEDPPCLLYASGDLSLLKNPGVAVVGARECTALGLDAAGRISSQLSRIGITVISGLALGIDRQAHLGGLSGIGGSIAVLGCGLDVDYPYGNHDVRRALDTRGLVVTEFGPGVTPRAGNFPFRNRIISALSLGVLVAEAAHNSGSLITARLAGEQGREVFALPGPLGQPTFTGCHRLIKQGAALVESAEDIVEILRYDFARELAHIPDPEPVAEADGSVDALGARPERVGPGRSAASDRLTRHRTPQVTLTPRTRQTPGSPGRSAWARSDGPRWPSATRSANSWPYSTRPTGPISILWAGPWAGSRHG